MLNIVSSFGGTIAYDIGYFFLRALFVRCLAEEYLGLEGLFSNILGVLSLMELGIGPAMTVSLYKPLAENNVEKIKCLMSLYKKAYQAIGICVFAVGTSLTPFLGILIKDAPSNIGNIKIIYLLYVANTAISYFCIYKQSLFIADQKNYLVTCWYNIARIVMLCVQAAVLVIFRNYVIFLLVQIAFTRGANLYISYRADKQYQYLKEHSAFQIDKKTKDEVLKYAYASTILNIGSKLVNGTDQIIISSMIGIAMGGYYSNYTMVTGAILSIESKLLNACTASIGNLNVTGSKNHFKEVFDRFLFVGFSIASFCSVCLIVLFRDFISVWVGNNMLLDWTTTVCLVSSFYLYSIRLAVQVFNSATGNFHHFKYRAFAEGAINLIVSIIFVKLMGITGVVLGTIFSCILVPFWIEPYILYKYILNEKFERYLVLFLRNFAFTGIVAICLTFSCSFIPLSGWGGLIIKGFVCASVFSVVYVLIYHKNSNFKYFLNFIISKVKVQRFL